MYAKTKSTRKFVILYQSRDRRPVLYFLLLSKSSWMFRFSFKMSKLWPAKETTNLYYNSMYLPARLISAPWGTTKADKCSRLSLNLFTAAVDRDGQACTKKACNQNVPICTLKVKTKCNKRLYFISYCAVVHKKNWKFSHKKFCCFNEMAAGVICFLLFAFFSIIVQQNKAVLSFIWHTQHIRWWNRKMYQITSLFNIFSNVKWR